jgi:non-ribosomal peptide synthetase component E (peptide arylation enzyme)
MLPEHFVLIGVARAQGPTVHLGYHNNTPANAASFTEDGWFRTGDLAASPMIAATFSYPGAARKTSIAAGRNSFPARLRKCSTPIPDLLHAAMIGLPDARLGERNCLCIIPKFGHDLSLDEALTFLEGQIADHKLPETIERFEECPMTGTGKIRRHVLRDLVLARRGGLA